MNELPEFYQESINPLTGRGFDIPEADSKENGLEGGKSKAAWVSRHKLAIGVSGIALAGALSATQFNDTIDGIKDSAAWAAPAIASTETIAWAGAGIMLLSAGKKIGNPLTVKKRLNQVASELQDNKLLRAGWIANVAGATGTSTVIVAGAATSLPINSWPLAAGAAGASLAFSALPLKSAIMKSSEKRKVK